MAAVKLLGSPPLKVSECAAYMGVGKSYILNAINVGVPVNGVLVQLEAERIPGTQRHTYRIHEHAFLAFLQAIGWKHLPTRGVPSPVEQQREVH